MCANILLRVEEKQKEFIRFKISGLELDLYHCRSKQRQVKKITRRAKREYEKDMAKNIKHNRLSFSISGEKNRLGPVWAH